MGRIILQHPDLKPEAILSVVLSTLFPGEQKAIAAEAETLANAAWEGKPVATTGSFARRLQVENLAERQIKGKAREEMKKIQSSPGDVVTEEAAFEQIQPQYETALGNLSATDQFFELPRSVQTETTPKANPVGATTAEEAAFTAPIPAEERQGEAVWAEGEGGNVTLPATVDVVDARRPSDVVEQPQAGVSALAERKRLMGVRRRLE